MYLHAYLPPYRESRPAGTPAPLIGSDRDDKVALASHYGLTLHSRFLGAGAGTIRAVAMARDLDRGGQSAVV